MQRRYRLRMMRCEQREVWDRYVAAHPHGHLLQSWGWGELKASSGWRPLRLALWDERQQSLVGAAQVLRRSGARVPFQAGYLAYIPKGPLLDWRQVEQCAAFVEQLSAYLRQHGALALLIEPAQELEVTSESAAGAQDCFAPLQLYPAPAVQPLRTIRLDLQPGEETLRANMKEKWRYNLRLAERKGVIVRPAQSEHDVRAWYELLQTTSQRDDFGIHTLDYYLRAWNLFAPHEQARLLLAEHEGTLLAGIFVGLFAREGIYLYGASSNERRNLMPNYLLQWQAILWAKQQGATSYDFWGIPATDDAQEAMAGVYRFKSGWGGRVVNYVGCFEHAFHPMGMRLARQFLPGAL